jgi:hypothetical protein
LGSKIKSSHHPKNNSIKQDKPSSHNRLDTLTPLQRFEKSMEVTFEKWHDGIGYDLDALKEASPTELEIIQQIIINHYPRDWRDIEALAQIDTSFAKETIKKAIEDRNPAVRAAAGRFAPELITSPQRSKSIVDALQNADIFEGLSQILDEIVDFHPLEVKEALLRGLLNRKGDVAVLFAAMLFYLYGHAKEPFDWAQRPFFLRFNTENKEERIGVFKELCKKLNIEAVKYLNE